MELVPPRRQRFGLLGRSLSEVALLTLGLLGLAVTSARAAPPANDHSKRATWSTTDRCDGTLTSVRRGRVSVLDRRRRREVTVRPGRVYLARARLFTLKKGRVRPPRRSDLDPRGLRR